jgi:hypothetical protein
MFVFNPNSPITAVLTFVEIRVVNSSLNVAMHFQEPEMVYGVCVIYRFTPYG